tara:strand:+ start:251 stop:520 length:270 start_codon:yes stop_codon:yes gene_type:complete
MLLLVKELAVVTRYFLQSPHSVEVEARVLQTLLGLSVALVVAVLITRVMLAQQVKVMLVVLEGVLEVMVQVVVAELLLLVQMVLVLLAV